MIIPRTFVAVIAALLLTGAAQAQSAADLLQKGIHAQETVGDLDGAIQIFRQVASSPATNKQLAAQAQYQLVLCVLQKGDRPGAERELALLARNFADQPDLIGKARKLIPGSNSMLPAPWLDGELEQLNIKRDGVFTGETITYSADLWRNTVPAGMQSRDASYPNSVYLRWELTTTKSKRSIQMRVDRDTLQDLDKEPQRQSDDLLGDATATSLMGPALDPEESVFLIRRMPLAVGYKTTIPVTSGFPVAVPTELTVAGIESVQVPAGKFNCFKITFAKSGQTLWIAVDGTKPVVKFHSDSVDAELVKVWDSTNPLDRGLQFVRDAGWFVSGVAQGPGPEGGASIYSRKDDSGPGFSGYQAAVTYRRVYTPSSEIERSLRQTVEREAQSNFWGISGGYNAIGSVHPDSLQIRLINGQQAAVFVIDRDYEKGRDGLVVKDQEKQYCAIIQTENGIIEFRTRDQYVPNFRWLFDPILETARIP